MAALQAIVTKSALNAIVNTVQDYSSNYYTDPNYQVIGVNDESIDNGGVFDICETSAAGCANGLVAPWQPPHNAHHEQKHSMRLNTHRQRGRRSGASH